MIPAPQPRERGLATSVDGTRIAWRRYGEAGPSIVFVPTWNLVDARVVGHQVAALEPHATVVTFDPRGAGESDRPASGYDFPLHAADALAVMGATGVEDAAVVTASRGLNAVVLLAAEHPLRVTRLAAVAPYMRLEPAPEPPAPERLERWRNDWPGFIGPFMHAVFSEPDSAQLIEEMIAIGLDASPDVVAGAGDSSSTGSRRRESSAGSSARPSSSTARPTYPCPWRWPTPSSASCPTRGSW